VSFDEMLVAAVVVALDVQGAPEVQRALGVRMMTAVVGNGNELVCLLYRRLA